MYLDNELFEPYDYRPYEYGYGSHTTAIFFRGKFHELPRKHDWAGFQATTRFLTKAELADRCRKLNDKYRFLK